VSSIECLNCLKHNTGPLIAPAEDSLWRALFASFRQ
jgi:hypothetical protein